MLITLLEKDYEGDLKNDLQKILLAEDNMFVDGMRIDSADVDLEGIYNLPQTTDIIFSGSFVKTSITLKEASIMTTLEAFDFGCTLTCKVGTFTAFISPSGVLVLPLTKPFEEKARAGLSLVATFDWNNADFVKKLNLINALTKQVQYFWPTDIIITQPRVITELNTASLEKMQFSCNLLGVKIVNESDFSVEFKNSYLTIHLKDAVETIPEHIDKYKIYRVDICKVTKTVKIQSEE